MNGDEESPLWAWLLGLAMFIVMAFGLLGDGTPTMFWQ